MGERKVERKLILWVFGCRKWDCSGEARLFS